MPVGYFSMLLLLVAFVGSVALIIFSAMKSTDVYKDALARVKADPAVIESLGSPITDRFLSLETPTLMAHPEKRTSPLPYPAQMEKGLFTWPQKSRSVAGITQGSLWKSKKRVSGSIFSVARRRQTHPDDSGASQDKEAVHERNFL